LHISKRSKLALFVLCPATSYMSFVVSSDISKQSPQDPSAVLESLSRLHKATSQLLESLQEVLEAISQLEDATATHM
jgi:hypothetical protein